MGGRKRTWEAISFEVAMTVIALIALVVIIAPSIVVLIVSFTTDSRLNSRRRAIRQAELWNAWQLHDARRMGWRRLRVARGVARASVQERVCLGPSVCRRYAGAGARSRTWRTKTGRLWVYAREQRGWGGPEPPAAVYLFAPDRRAERPASHLENFKGVLHVDGYAGFEPLTENGDVVHRPLQRGAELERSSHPMSLGDHQLRSGNKIPFRVGCRIKSTALLS